MTKPQSQWLSVEPSGDETVAAAFKRLTASSPRGNYYIDSVYFQVCPEKGHYASQALLKSCKGGSPTANWSGSVNLLSAVGWGKDQIVNNYNASKSDPKNGVYAYDFPVSQNSSGARLVYRTYLTLKEDDSTAVLITHGSTNGYTCCDRM